MLVCVCTLGVVVYTGQSLIWVGILGFIILYIYSLAGFAYLRDIFDPGNHAFCASLSQCFVSVIRYGLIGDIGDEEVLPYCLSVN